jgi:hypothetical protein
VFQFKIIAAACVLGFLALPPAFAADVSIIKGDPGARIQGGETLRLTPDKSELIRLNRSAASVIVGNPAHINVLADSANTLVIVPKAPGASHFTALDADGTVILQQHVIVASPQKNYLRVRRTCSPGDETCQATSVFYCPDMCHEILMNQDEAAGPQAEASSAGGSSDANYAGSTPPSADGS